MDEALRTHLFSATGAFDHPVTTLITGATIVGLVGSGLAIAALRLRGGGDAERTRELVDRWKSWCVLAPLMLGPILLGAAWMILAVTVLSLLCYREFARVTGLFRHHRISAVVVVGILAVAFAVFDNWPGLFFALPALVVVTITAVALIADTPEGYIQRVALAIFGFLFFGVCLGHFAYLANDADFRPICLMLLFTVELNDIFAFLSGKTFGRRKFAPRTSPNKTMAGSLGAVVATTALVAALGHFVFRSTPLDGWLQLLGLGLLVSIAGQMGDLVLSSIKRDIGIKDIGTLIPGHGGLLDRFDSLILIAPAFAHYVNYVRGIGVDQAQRIFTGG